MSDELSEMTFDELASAYLDGEATVEEAAQVESDPRLQALVEELREVKGLVAAPVESPADDVRDQMIAQALDHRASVTSLEKARFRLRAVPPKAKAILAVAAVVAVLAVLGVTLFNRTSQDAQDHFADNSATVPEMADSAADIEEMQLPVPAADDESSEIAEEALMAETPEIAEEVLMAETPEIAEEVLMAETPEVAGQGSPLVAERFEEAAGVDLMGCPVFSEEGLALLARFEAAVGETETQVSVYLSDGDLLLAVTTPPAECEMLNSRTLSNWLE